MKFKTSRESAITQQRLALNRSHTYTPTHRQAPMQAEIQPSMCERLHLLLLRAEGDGSKMKKRYQNWQERNRSNSLIFTLDVYSNNLISSWVFLMISVGDLQYNQQERPPKSAQCTTHYLIRGMILCMHRTLATWISLSLSLSFFFFDRLYVTTHHPIMSFQPNFSIEV